MNQLVDGSAPASAEQVVQALLRLKVSCRTIEHPPLRTVSDSKAHRRDPQGGYSKNLFLRNKKGRMWLLTMHEDRHVDLRSLGAQLQAGRVSFASERRLMHYLGVIPGAVTPLAVINDRGNHVTAVLDRKLMDYDRLHFHPCDNARTTSLPRDGLLTYMRAYGHDPLIVDLDEFEVAP